MVQTTKPKKKKAPVFIKSSLYAWMGIMSLGVLLGFVLSSVLGAKLIPVGNRRSDKNVLATQFRPPASPPVCPDESGVYICGNTCYNYFVTSP